PSFFAELKRRHVYRVAIAYVVAAWLLLQLGAIVFPVLRAPSWCEGVLLGFLVLGFPVAVLLAWAFEVTPEGVRHTESAESEEARPKATGRRVGHTLNFAIIAILVAAIGVLAWRQFLYRPQPPQITKAVSAVPASSAAAHAAAVSPRATPAIPGKSIAVLPLVNESGDPKEQYFSDGLSEDLITALSQFAGLKVISRDSSFRFRNSNDSSQVIGEKLGVAHLLEGSVSREGGEVRISAELVNATDGTTLWSEHYDRPYKDLFALQDDITKAVADVLKAKLLTVTSSTAVVQSDRPPSGNLAAYNAYLQGQFYYQRGSEADLYQAIAQFTAATRLDPHYAAAYAGVSNTWTLLAGYVLSGTDKPGAYAKARNAAQTALRLNPELALAHDAYATVLENADLDWSGAQAELRRALELAPGSLLTQFELSSTLADHGFPESAVKLVRQPLSGNPLQAFWTTWLASYQAALGRLDEAEVTARGAVALAPQAAFSYRKLTAIEVLRGDASAALAAARSTPPGRNQDIAMAWALQIGPDRAAADAALKNLIAKHSGDSSYQIADVFALRKDPDNMFKWLDQAWINRDDGIQYLLYDPMILRYKNDPRFAAFCKKVGLPTTTAAKAMP
ncbi:MAG: hypothetical protein ACRETC_12485, partial [Gammaproteobacteria bacterium]